MAPEHLYKHQAVNPAGRYGPLAVIYDRVMSHVEYDRWHEMVDHVSERYFAGRAPAILEIGAGTATLGLRLRGAGYRYTGSDLSVHMCRQGRLKGLPQVCADGRMLPFRQDFDMVLFLYDGINYLFTAEEYGALFNEAFRVLRPGGFLLFDITTRHNSMTYFLDHIYYEDLGGHFYVRHSYFDPSEDIQYNDFTIFSRRPGDSRYERAEEKHSQKLFPYQTIRRWIAPERFDLLGVWDGFSRRPASRHSERVHFLLRRRGEA